MYFTTLHYIAVAFFGVVLLLLLILSFREKNPKNKKAMIFLAISLTTLGTVITLFGLEKYTKKAKLLNYTQKRLLSTESVVFSGKIKNIGKFEIGECKVKIKFTNNVLKIGKVKNGFFKPSNGLGFLFGDDKKSESKPNTIEKEFSAVKNLKPKEIRDFRIDMRYPTYMNAPLIRLKLDCS